MENSLADTNSQIASEWSELNGDLRPDMVGARSRRNVWWHCPICRNEYRMLIGSRMKGLSCPYCSNQRVLQGFNDLTTTDPQLVEEWDCEKNTLSPEGVPRTCCYRVWWKCKNGHRWSMKIADRTLKGRGCIHCEKEFLSTLPALAAAYYAYLMPTKVVTGDTDLTGLPLAAYIPEIGLAIDIDTRIRDTKQAQKERHWKQQVCRTKNVTLLNIPKDQCKNRDQLLQLIKTAFQRKNVFVGASVKEDLLVLEKAFDRLRERSS